MGVFRNFPYSNFHEMNMDEILKILKTLSEEWDATKTEWANYKEFIDDYFENLDVSEEVLNALRIFAMDGTLNEILDPTIASTTTQWLIDNISATTGTTVIDASLSVAGAAADAKATGDGINGIAQNANIFPASKVTPSVFLDANGNVVQSQSTICLSPYIPIIPNSDYIIGPTFSNTSTIFHCFYDKNRNFISSIYASVNNIHTPKNAEFIRISLATVNLNDLTIKYIKTGENIVIMGDSWSDTNPEHTPYTKWPVLLARDSDYNIFNYAQNGALISGNDPNYNVDGNLLGQVEYFLTQNIAHVDTFIIMGGINDFRGGVASGYVSQRIQLTEQRLRLNYPNARIIYIANHQIFVTHEQIEYFNTVLDYVHRIVGIEAYTTFGWINPTNYIEDYVHPNNAGYVSIVANIKSILNGGAPYTVKSTHTFGTVADGFTMDVVEEWLNNAPSYRIKATLYTAGFNRLYTFDFSNTNNYFIASVPFTKILSKVQPSTVLMQNCIVDDTVSESFSTSHKMNASNTIIVRTAGGNSGGYRSANWY